ncbi:hypothetical protein ON010_g9888 [Phytophthora cinnamomi]|nr:hypothetical protein ON010_g9888 [Phytophthora cinnamomi]
MALASEVYDLLLVHSITYRSRAAVIRKLHWLEEQFDRAEGWLKRTGIQDFNDSSESEDMLLSMCPVYPTIAHVLRSARRSVANTSSQASRNTSVGASFRQATQKSAAARTKRSYPKRPSSHPQLDSVGAKGVAILKAEPEERREFFKLELQVKRDQAICVRAKARKELFDMGMSPEDVDRLLPL